MVYYIKKHTYCEHYHKCGTYCDKHGRLKEGDCCNDWNLQKDYQQND